MQIDPVAISLGAFGVSLASLLYSFYTGRIQRRLQVEQIRLAIQSTLLRSALKTNDLAKQILQGKPSSIAQLAACSLINLAQDISYVWSKIPNLKIPWFIPLGRFAVSYQQLKNDVDEVHELLAYLSDLIVTENFDELQSKAELLRKRVSGFEREN